jgi:tripartite-type tricarboxylate transporter receptor subunit TctC
MTNSSTRPQRARQAPLAKRLLNACRVLGMAAATLALTPAASAQPATAAWTPVKPIRMVVPYPPGGGSDTVARIVVQGLGNRLGQPVVIENRGGANGAVGTEVVYHAPPDGHTLLMSSADTYSMYPPLYATKTRFVSSEFVPITPSAKVNFVIMGRPDLPAKNMQELIALAKKGRLTYGTWGVGSGAHIAMSLFMTQARVTEMNHIPYQGAAPAAQAAMAGQVDLAIMPMHLAASYRSKLQAFGVAAPERVSSVNDIPTLTEQGLPVLADAWVGVLAPPKTSPAIAAVLAKAFSDTMADPEVRAKLNAVGLVPFSGSSEEFAAYLAKDYAFWGKTIRAAGIRVEE